MKPIKYNELVKALVSNGYTEQKRKNGGNHAIFRNDLTGSSLSIPRGKEVSSGVLRQVARLIPLDK